MCFISDLKTPFNDKALSWILSMLVMGYLKI